ncbi:hypothetical protein, variant 2 [Verruconis gallopava]|nr:hypothetical protein, variant 2 [Verruconis gallopava]KIW09633.1 hypothetical protein, variant 2 [Verruconis gallopava]
MPSLDSLTPRSQSIAPTSPSRAVTEHSPSPRPRARPRTISMARASSPESFSFDEIEADSFSAPMTSLFEVTKLKSLRVRDSIGAQSDSALTNDFISLGRISLQDAEELFNHFTVSLNQYLWGGIALVHNDLTSTRKSSSLLSAAIIAVTALHIRGKEEIFDAAYTEFLSLVSESMFERRHSLDDIRAFCIGAFWLSDVSWKLSGHAVRIATELNLHQSFSKAIRGQAEHVERARLWYLLYVCDHHFSIAYGRPPVIQEDMAITCHETFLQVPGITQADWRLQSQVAIFRILSRMYRQFGADTDKALSEADFTALRAFNAEFDSWRTKWEPRLAANKYVSTYPSRGTIVHWNFAKLQVNALALRGLSPRQAHLISDQRRDFANLAIAHALGTLSFILEDSSVRSSIQGVPLYMHTVVTYASMFLLRVQLRWRPARLNVNMSIVNTLIERMAQLLSQANTSERHLSLPVANGLIKMLAKSKKFEPSGVEQGQAVHDLGSYSAMGAASQEEWSGADSGSDTMFGDMGMYTAFDNELLAPTFFDMVTQQMPG